MQNQFCWAKVEALAGLASSGNSEGESNSLPFSALVAAYTGILHFIASQVLQIECKALHQQKDYDSLYCDAHFNAEAWNQTCNISEVCLYFVACGPFLCLQRIIPTSLLCFHIFFSPSDPLTSV